MTTITDWVPICRVKYEKGLWNPMYSLTAYKVINKKEIQIYKEKRPAPYQTKAERFQEALIDRADVAYYLTRDQIDRINKILEVRLAFKEKPTVRS